jgi:hypothetical protein
VSELARLTVATTELGRCEAMECRRSWLDLAQVTGGAGLIGPSFCSVRHWACRPAALP